MSGKRRRWRTALFVVLASLPVIAWLEARGTVMCACPSSETRAVLRLALSVVLVLFGAFLSVRGQGRSGRVKGADEESVPSPEGEERT